MKKHSVKVLSLVLALIMTLSLCPLEAFAAGNQWGWGNWWDQAEGPEMPAQQLKAHDDETGVSVTVDAPEGALPQGTTLSVKSVSLPAVQTIVDNDANASGTVVAAEDITFYYEGSEIEPEKNVSVTLASDVISNTANPTVLHLDCSAEEIESGSVPVEIMGSGNSFSSKDFSVYAVVEDNQPSDYARLEVRFFNADDAEEPFTSVYVTKRDKDILGKIIPDPEPPATEPGQLFCGWSVGTKYTESDVDGRHTIDFIRAQVKTYLETNDVHEGDTFDVYAMIFYYFNVAYVDENSETTLSTEIHYSKTPSATITAQLIYAPYEQGYRFIGWQKDDGDENIYQNGDTVTVTNPITRLRAQVEQGYWLIFDENPGEKDHYKGATYVAPIFCPQGRIPAEAASKVSSLSGYDFTGWYLTFNENETDATQDSWANKINFSTPITQDTTVKAGWALNDSTSYTLIVWKQTVNDDKNAADEDKTYDFAFSTTVDAAPNTAIRDLDLSYYQTVHSYSQNGETSTDGINTKTDGSGTWYSFYGFEYNSTRGPVSSQTKVLPNGTTVVNIYWNRRLCTLDFKIKNNYVETTTWSDSNTIYTKDSAGNYAEVYRYSFNQSSYPYTTYYRYLYVVSSLDLLVHDDGVNDTFDNTHYFYRTGNSSSGYTTYWVWWSDTNSDWVYGTSSKPIDYYSSSNTLYYWINDVTSSTTLPDNATFYNYNSSASWTTRETYTGLYGQKLSKYNYTWKTDYRWFHSDPDNTSGTMYLTSFLETFSMSVNDSPQNNDPGYSTFYGTTFTRNAKVYHYLQTTSETWPEENAAEGFYSVDTNTTTGMVFRRFSGFTASEYRVKLPDGVTQYRTSTSATNTGTQAKPSYTYEWGSYVTATDGWTEWIPVDTALDFDYTYTYDGESKTYSPDTEDIDRVRPLGGLNEYRYTRNQYRINYMVGAYFDRNGEISGPVTGSLKRTSGIYYEASVDSYKVGGANYYNPVTAGDFTDSTFIFDGWYVDPECTTKYDFTGKTMPLNGITVYAKFIQREYRVFLRDHAEEGQVITWTDEDQQSNFRVAYNDVISNGNAIEGSATGTGNTKYVLVGWYLDEAYTKPFNFGTHFTDDLGSDVVKEYGATEKADPQYATESDGTNKDADRPWIDHMVILHAKWRKVVDGAAGITVKYDAIEQAGTNGKTGKFAELAGSPTTYTDPLYYLDQASVMTHPASTPDESENYQFLYWEVLDKNGNPTGEQIYPGQFFDVDIDNAVIETITGTGNSTGNSTSTSTSTTDSSAGIVTRSVGPITPVTASEKLLTEGFESGTAFTESTSSTSTLSTTGWTAYNAGKGNNWNNYAGGSSYTHGGSYAARYYFSNSQDANCYLISAPFDVSSEATSLNLSLWAKSGGYNEAFEAFFVKTSEATTSGGVVSATHYTALASDTYTNSAYVQKKGSVADLAGESVRLVIHCTSPKNQFYLYIDDIAVTATLPDGDEPTMSDLDEALNVEGGNLHFTINEDDTYPWYVPEGQSYAQSGNAGISSSSSYLYLDLAMQAGDKLSFKYYVSSESSYDWFVFHDDGSESYSSGVLRLAGTYDWTTYEYTAETSGTYHFVWQFRKDSSTNYGEDCARLDDVEFLPTVPTYTITWNYTNSAGESASTTTSVKKNEMPVVPDIIPTSYEEDGVPYDLTGWTPTIAAATENTAYTAQYAVRQYDVTFNYKDANGNDQTSTQKVSHGQKATAPTDIPTTYTVNGKEYTFGGWDPDPTITPVTSDLTITASYYRDGYFTVIFKNWNGTVLKTQEVQRGQDATAPADPTRDGDFTFKGWDKDFTNVQSNLVVYAVFGHAITKTYTVTLRAVYGPKVKLEKTHIVWYANNDTGDYMESEDVPMNADIQIPVPAKDYPTTPAETYKYKKWDTTLGTVTEDLVWTNHEFLGWARVKESDNEGNLIWAEPEDHPKQLSLTYDDLFLKYDPATKTFTADQNCPAYDTQTGSSGAKTTPNWTSVNYVAADELTPYHAMYAVWANVFYVYHSGTGKVERIVIDSTLYEKKADGTNDLTKPTKNTFDLTELVSPGYLYGGYYKDYAGKSDGFNAKTATGWTKVTSVDAIKTKATVTPVATNVGLSDLVGMGRISQITDTGATLYNYDNLSKDLEKMVEDGEMTAEAAEAFEAKLTWNWIDSYNADDKIAVYHADTDSTEYIAKAVDRPGNAIIPEAGKTYYIKEVPASMYLLHYTHYTYKFGKTDGVENKIMKMWMISDIDDLNYQGAGFTYLDDNHNATVVAKLNISTNGSSKPHTDELTAATLFGQDSGFGKDKGVTSGWLTYSALEGNALTAAQQAGKIAGIQNYWITPDNMMVTGDAIRTLVNIKNTAISTATLETGKSNITPYTPANNTNP